MGGLGDLFGIYDRYREHQTQRGANEMLSDFRQATGPEDVQFIQRTMPSYQINDPRVAYSMYNEGDQILDRFRKEDDSAQLGGAYAKLISAAQKDPNTPIMKIAGSMTPRELSAFVREAGGKVDDLYKANQIPQDASRKVATERGNREAMANLDYVYREKDPLQAFSRIGELIDVTGADPSVIGGKMVDDSRQYLEKLPVGAPRNVTRKVGDTTEIETLQDFALGGSKSLGSTQNRPRVEREDGGSGGGKSAKSIEGKWAEYKRMRQTWRKERNEENERRMNEAYDEYVAAGAAVGKDVRGKYSDTAPAKPSAKPEASKSIGGRNYVKIGGQWYEE